MKIVIASDSYKQSLSSKKVAKAIKKGFEKVFFTADFSKVALADGGEGTVEALVDNLNGEIFKTEVLNPIDKKIPSFYGMIDNKTAVLELASSSGLHLIKEEDRNPLDTSTFGFGQQINHAIKNGASKLILGLGGSATNDAGIGMLQALGVKFYDEHNIEISKRKVLCARDIPEIKNFDISALKRLEDIEIVVACDVSNPLCGENGASYIYGKQKGADEKMIERLDKSLLYFAKLCERKLAKKTKNLAGSGAAGGVGFALITFLKAELQSGIEIISKLTKLEKKIINADLVITGEGRVDEQTIYGKTVLGVVNIAKKHGVPVIVIAGSLGKGYERLYGHGVEAVFDITPSNLPETELFAQTEKNLISTSHNIAKVLRLKF